MWPTILSIGPLAIHSFGLMVLLGVFFGGFWFWQKGREEGFKEESLMDVWLASGLVGLLLGRVWFVLSNWPEFVGNIYKMLFVTKYPGFSYSGVLVGGLVMMVIQALKRKWNVWKMLETGIFSLILVEMFGFLGSFLAGSSLGKVTDWFWGLGFPGVEGRRHPAQLVMIFGLWLVLLLLKKWEKEYRSFKWYKGDKGEAKSGFLVAVYLMGLGSLKMLVGLMLELNNVTAYYWFNGFMFAAGALILLARSGIYNRVAVTKKAETPQSQKKVELVKPRKVKRKKKGFDFK